MKPFDHLRQEEVKRIVQTYLAYLSDKMNLLSNPGILVSTRAYLTADNTLTVCNYNSHVFIGSDSIFQYSSMNIALLAWEITGAV